MSTIEHKPKKKKRWLWILAILAILIIPILIYVAILYTNVTKTAQEIHEPIDRKMSAKRTEAIMLTKQDPLSVLVLGVDERAGDSGRSDTMIVLAVNPNLQSTKMVSIPRDTYTDIVGKGIKDKINHAYAFGGIEMAMDTTEQLLDIPIDYVVQVNMESFKDIVDTVGGVTVTNSLNFSVDEHTFPVGEISLNGDEALAFVRMRSEDPRGDFGRQDRQKQVIQAVLREGASFSSLLKYKEIFQTISTNVKTNMTFEEMVDIQKNYRDAVKEIDQIILTDGSGQKMNGIWYYMMNDAELENVQQQLKMHLEL